jgi:hypothetical protein
MDARQSFMEEHPMKRKVVHFYSYIDFLLQWMWRRQRALLLVFLASGVVSDVVTTIKDILTRDWFELVLTWPMALVIAVGILIGFRWAKKEAEKR